MGDIRELVRTFVVDNFVLDPDDQTFTDETDLRESGILDSLAVLRFITFIQDQFAVKLDAVDLELEGLFSIANVEALVRSHKS